jgi:hypothetical protein
MTQMKPNQPERKAKKQEPQTNIYNLIIHIRIFQARYAMQSHHKINLETIRQQSKRLGELMTPIDMSMVLI